MPSWKKVITSGSDATLNSLLVTTSITASSFSGSHTGSLLGTASYVTGSIHTSANPALSASYALSSSFATTSSFANSSLTASYLNPLNQGNVIITGSVYISGSNSSLILGGNTTASTEASLIIGLPPNGVNTGEGGQIILQAPNSGGFTSASMIDNFQNQFRILRGNNTASDASHFILSMHTGQLGLPKYLNTTSFPGTATANLAIDSAGNVITVSTSGGTVFPYTGTATISGSLVVTGSAGVTGSISSTGPIYSQANNSLYFRGGDDAEFWDINVPNTVGIYGQQDQTTAGIKLGSGGGTLTGKNGSIGIGTTTPNPSTLLDVAGNTTISGSLRVTGSAGFTGSVSVVNGGFTGSLLGTASYVTGSIFTGANQATSASYSITSSFATTATQVAANLTQGTGINTFTYNGSSAQTVSVAGASTLNTNRHTKWSGTAFVDSLIFDDGSTNVFITGSNIVISGSSAALRVTGSVVSTGGFTGSLLGTASFTTGSIYTAGNLALSSSYAVTWSGWTYSTPSTYIPVWTGTALSSSAMRDTGTQIRVAQQLSVTAGGIESLAGGITSSNGLIVTGSVSATQGGFTGSLLGTSSWANNVVTAQTASYLNNLNQNLSITGSVILSGSSLVELVVLGEQQITGSLRITGSLGVTGSFSVTGSGFNVLGDTQFTGSITSFSGYTGSLFGTSSWASNVVTAQTASYLNNLNQNLSVTGSVILSGSGGTELIVLGDQNITGSLNISGSILMTPSGSITIVSGSVRALSFTGSLLGTASYVTGSIYTAGNLALSASYALTASYALNAAAGGLSGTGTANRVTKFTGASTVGDSNIFDDGTNIQITGSAVTISGSSAILRVTGSISAVGGFTGSLLGTASFANNTATASYVNNLNQNVTVSGSLFVTASTSNTAIRTIGDVMVSGTFYSTASFSDNSFVGVGNLINTGSIIVTRGGFTGSLLGTASFVTGSIFTVGNLAISSSYAVTASFLVGNLKSKAGSVANTSFAGSPRTAAVTFTTAFPNTSYAVTITGEDNRAWMVQSKATTGFTINSNSTVALGGTTYWVAIAYGEN
jgi:hypothetical protein